MCPPLAQLIIGFFSFFLLRPFTVLMKKTRAVKQSIFLDIYGYHCATWFSKQTYLFLKDEVEEEEKEDLKAKTFFFTWMATTFHFLSGLMCQRFQTQRIRKLFFFRKKKIGIDVSRNRRVSLFKILAPKYKNLNF